MLRRLLLWLWQLFLTVDQFFAVWLRGWRYVWFGGELPYAEETISSWVGKRSAEGHRWAGIAEKLLDALFCEDHCRVAHARFEARLKACSLDYSSRSSFPPVP